jgi:hypothetical protein
MVSRTETILAGLRGLAVQPEAQAFHFCDDVLHARRLHLFPNQGREGDDNRAIARPLARMLGGIWTADRDQWNGKDITFPGLVGVEVTIFYIEPCRPQSRGIDLSEPEPMRETVPANPEPVAP